MLPLWKVDFMIFAFLVFVVLMWVFRHKSKAWQVLSVLVIFPCFLAIESVRMAAKDRGLEIPEGLAEAFFLAVIVAFGGFVMESNRRESGKSVWSVWRWVAGSVALVWAGWGFDFVLFFGGTAITGLAAGSIVAVWGKPAILALLFLLCIAMTAVRIWGGF